jgi:hypothetical protein
MVSPLGMKSARYTGRSASFQLIVPNPVPVLSVAIDAVSAFSNIAAGRRQIEPRRNNLTETVWVSVRSGSSNAIVPEVGTWAVKSPPGTLVPPVNAIVCGTLEVMTGTSLVPVIVMVNVAVPVSWSGA